jgi:hypothetical protein
MDCRNNRVSDTTVRYAEPFYRIRISLEHQLEGPRSLQELLLCIFRAHISSDILGRVYRTSRPLTIASDLRMLRQLQPNVKEILEHQPVPVLLSKCPDRDFVVPKVPTSRHLRWSHLFAVPLLLSTIALLPHMWGCPRLMFC